MGIQYTEAPPGTVFEPTYEGRYLKQKFEQDPKLKYKVPKRWLSEGQVRFKKETDDENKTAVNV